MSELLYDVDLIFGYEPLSLGEDGKDLDGLDRWLILKTLDRFNENTSNIQH